MQSENELSPTTHRFHLLDAIFVSGATGVALCLGFTRDLSSHHVTEVSSKPRLDANDILAVIAILIAGLAWSVSRHKRVSRAARARAVAEKEIRRLAFSDHLTGLPNRHQFDLSLLQALSEPPCSGGSVALLLLDLDGFKRVNDVFGHAAGDELLARVGSLISRSLRKGDILARLGGDEFAIIARDVTSHEDVLNMARRIFEELKPPVSAAGKEHLIGTSIGISLSPKDTTDPRELFRKADIALYRAKESGGRSSRFFEDQMDITLKERDVLERELRAAVDADEVVPYFQPVVDLGSGRIKSFEALARWTSPQLGIIPPGRFIAVAEEAGIIAQLTNSLLRQALAEAARWPDDIRLAFNISPASLRDEGFAESISRLVSQAGIPASRLEIEVTESVLVRDLETARDVLGQLRAMGFRIVLDDFGTGYSSLYHLCNFKLDKIKIDQTFIKAMAVDRDRKLIVRAVIGLASGLGLEVVAEGVENELQRNLLHCYCCDQAQGYYYSRGLPGDAALALALQHDQSLPGIRWEGARGPALLCEQDIRAMEEGIALSLLAGARE